MRSACWPYGHGGLAPSQPHTAVVVGRDDRGLEDIVGAAFGERGGQHDLARDDAGQPRRALFRRAELGDRHGAERHGRPERNRCDASALLLEEEGQFDHALAAASVLLGQAEADQVGVGELPPELAIETIGLLDRLHPFDRRRPFEDLLGQRVG